MSNKRILSGVVIVAIIILGLWSYLSDEEASLPDVQTAENAEPSASAITEREIVKKQKADGSQVDVLSYKNSAGTVVEEELSINERSFAVMAKTLIEFTSPGKTKEDFITHLRSLGLKPIVAKDEQELIEDLTIIRTQNSLPGLRYIHAQYDGDGVQELQHLSFEVGKGEQAHQRAIELIQKVIPLGTREAGTDEKIAIFRNGKYVVWLKELTEEDMIGDPFNAYSKQDIGNIRVAVEREIHGHEDHDGHEH